MNSVYSGYAEGMYLPEIGVLCYVRYKIGEKYCFTNATRTLNDVWVAEDGYALGGKVIQWIPRVEILI